MRGITHTARQNVNGRQSYVCPICGHGSHGDGLTINPKGRPGALMCFGCGFSGDIIDLLQRVNGCDFNTALNTAAAELGITIDPYKSDAAADFADADRVQGAQRADKKKDRETATGTAKQPQRATGTATEGETADYTAYYAQCSERLNDPAALSYLQARGISAETAQRFGAGYDPQADPANAPGAMGSDYRPHPAPRLIIPCTRGYYVARATDPGNKFKAPNPKGSRAQLFNAGALYNPEPGVVFVTEGIFDALSFVEAGAQAVATNSKGNGQLLLDQLKRRPAAGTRFIICPDNDPNPKTNANTQATAQKLCDDLRALGNNCIVYNVAGQDHDANDALRRDKAGFAQRIAEAQAALQREALPGLLCYEDLVKEFQEADDSIITIKSFPEFSKTAKIKKHSTVALAADTGGGKSSLSLNFLNDLNAEYPCIYFNLEMDMITVLRRLVAIQSGLELDRIEGYKQDPKTAAAAGENVFTDILTVVLDIIPGNLVEPFRVDNDLQVIVIAIFVGIIMLILGSRVQRIREILDEGGALINRMMMAVCKLLPLFVYLGITNILLSDRLSQISSVITVFVITLAGAAVTIGITTIRTRIVTGRPLSWIVKAQIPSLLINLTTSSQVSAMPESMKCCKDKWHINEKMVDFGLPFGIVVYMPNGAIMLGATAWVLSVIATGPVDVTTLVKLALVSIIVAIAAPPIPGSAFAVLPILFSACGTDASMMPLAIVVGSTVGYLLPAMNGYCLQQELLMTACKTGNISPEET